MKKIVRFVYVLLLSFFVSTIVGCHKKNEDSVQPVAKQIESKDTNNLEVIRVFQNGISVEFCLINGNGQPAASFNEGEQFKFRLSITNYYDQDTSLYVITDFLKNPNLFMVFKSSSDSVGKPIKLFFIYKTGDYYNKIKKGEKFLVEIPWTESKGSELPFRFDNLINFFQYYYIGLNRPSLPKGKYYTEFNQKFCLGRYLPDPQVPICTDILQLRIDFEVK